MEASTSTRLLVLSSLLLACAARELQAGERLTVLPHPFVFRALVVLPGRYSALAWLCRWPLSGRHTFIRLSCIPAALVKQADLALEAVARDLCRDCNASALALLPMFDLVAGHVNEVVGSTSRRLLGSQHYYGYHNYHDSSAAAAAAAASGGDSSAAAAAASSGKVEVTSIDQV